MLAKAMERLTRRNLGKTLRSLTEYVIERGEADNISAAIVMNEER